MSPATIALHGRLSRVVNQSWSSTRVSLRADNVTVGALRQTARRCRNGAYPTTSPTAPSCCGTGKPRTLSGCLRASGTTRFARRPSKAKGYWSTASTLPGQWLPEASRRARLGEGVGLAVCRAVDAEPVASLELDAFDGREYEAEIGFWTLSAYRRHGYARAAVSLATGWALGPLGLRRVWADVDAGNAGSVSLLRAVGFGEPGGAELPPAMPARPTSLVLCTARPGWTSDLADRARPAGVSGRRLPTRSAPSAWQPWWPSDSWRHAHAAWVARRTSCAWVGALRAPHWQEQPDPRAGPAAPPRALS